MPHFDTLSEVILYVQDIDAIADFYDDVFGLDVVAGDPEHGFVAFDTGTCRLCLHAGGTGDLGGDAPKFVFDVDDIGAAREHLESHDVPLGELRMPAPGIQVYDGRDPEGNRFSIESSARSD